MVWTVSLVAYATRETDPYPTDETLYSFNSLNECANYLGVATPTVLYRAQKGNIFTFEGESVYISKR